jgi:hypothetical protein
VSDEPEGDAPDEEQPPVELPDQADPTDAGVFIASPDPEPDPEDPNTYPDENSPIGGGPLYRRTGP